MGAVEEEELTAGDTAGPGVPEERILVSVRLRPMNEKEITRNDVSDWECINSNTIIFKHSLPERSMFPSAYTFDRVFGHDSSTEQVYEEGAKEVALSVLSGINSSIFAYGQTSSGKTYTMTGITEHAVADIFNYIARHKEREFVMKFSAMEIYNEAVRDLLSLDITPLRLLDDPERGTVVEKLTEEILRDWSHLQELLSICEAQRQIGETALNETSSRSHQILRLTIESSAREFFGAENSSTLAATLNFVDLAGSERASQTLSAGTRLKEGCHINRSLLSLGTVVRKLSKGKTGHIPYRDSKLTRILQNSLGGNARTAIICTMSPARSHVEQSRNALSFASCAKNVSTNAQVNVLMSDKVLVKRLQRELAKLESELRSLRPSSVKCDSNTLLKEKEIRIEKMEKEITELTQQRDLAQSRAEYLLRSVGDDRVSRLDEYSVSGSSDITDHLSDIGFRSCNTYNNFDRSGVFNSDKHYLQHPENPEENFLLDDSSPNFVGPDPWEVIAQRTDENLKNICKDVPCIELEESSMNRKIEPNALLPGPEEKDGKLAVAVPLNDDALSSPKKGDNKLSHIHADDTYDALKRKIEEMQKTISYLVNLNPLEQSPCSSEADMSSSRKLKLTRSRSCAAMFMNIPSPWFEKAEQNENTQHDGLENDFSEIPEGVQRKLSELKYGADMGMFHNENAQPDGSEKDVHGIPEDFQRKLYEQKNGAKIGKIQNENAEPDGSKNDIHGRPEPLQRRVHELKYGANSGKVRRKSSQSFSEGIKKSDEEDVTSLLDFVVGPNEVAKLLTHKQYGDDLARETGLDSTQGALQLLSNWRSEFERKRREIIEHWDACYVPLVHRTYFFLLFKGDPSDSVYMEVELRRLSFLKDTFSRGTNDMKRNQLLTVTTSVRALHREREMLSKQVQKKYSKKEREELYQKWGIRLDTKQRSVQLAHRLWKDTKNIQHIKDSAALVAKLVELMEPGKAPKEIFGLSFTPRPTNQRSYGWKRSMSAMSTISSSLM